MDKPFFQSSLKPTMASHISRSAL